MEIAGKINTEQTERKQTEKYWGDNGLHNASMLRIYGFTLNNVATNMYFFLMVFVSYYLIGFVGMAVMLASSFATIMRLWDGFTDPIIGYMLDKTDGKFGKNRPFMIIGNIGLHVISFILFHITHQLPEGVIRTIFFFGISIIYYIFFTMQNAVTRAGQACLTNNPKRRPLFAMFDGINLVAMTALLNMFLAAYLVPKYGTFYSTGLFHELWLLCFGVSVISTVIAVIAIAPKDRTEYFGLGEATKILPKDYLEVIRKNKAIQMLIVAACTDKIALQSKVSAIPVVLYGVIVGNYALSGGLTLYTSIATILFCIAGSGYVATRFGQKRALVIGTIGGLIFNVLCGLLWLFGNPKTFNLPGFEGFSGFSIFTIALLLFTIMITGFQSVSGNIVIPMIADCADYEVYRSGRYVPGMMGTIFSFVDKSISSIAPTLTGLLFVSIGFKDALPDVTTPYSTSLLFLAVFISYGMPVLGLIMNLVAMKHYPLTREKMEEIQLSIANIKAGNTKEGATS